MVALQDVAVVFPGYPLRGGLPEAPPSIEGAWRAVRTGDLAAMEVDGGRLADGLPPIAPHPGLARFEVRPGDVLVRARATSLGGAGGFLAALVREVPEPSVAIFPVISIRARSGAVDPAYLAWWLAGSEAQAALAATATGSGLLALSPRALAELRVPLPPVDLQRGIAEGERLLLEEARLLLDLSRLRSRHARLVHTRAALAADLPTP